MKRILIAALLLLILNACSSEVYSLAYTARGDSNNMVALTQTDLLQRTDDLNVVVKLNSHDDSVTVSATFYNPDDEQVGEVLTTTADPDVGVVVLGLDYESRPGEEDEEEDTWQLGTWRVDIEVDGEQVESLSFKIN